MSHSVFFSIDAIGRAVDSARPESCSGTDTILELLASLSVEGDFFGLFDERNVCLQVRYESEENHYWLEVPRPDLGGSYGAHFSFDDAAKVFENLPDLFPETGFSGFGFSSW
jgi:hypothetical protein